MQQPGWAWPLLFNRRWPICPAAGQIGKCFIQKSPYNCGERFLTPPDLLGWLRTHKGELLTPLRAMPDAASIDRIDATTVWQAAPDRLEGDSSLFASPGLDVSRRPLASTRNSGGESQNEGATPLKCAVVAAPRETQLLTEKSLSGEDGSPVPTISRFGRSAGWQIAL